MSELLVWMRSVVRGMMMLPFLVLLIGLLIIVIQFTYRTVEYLSNNLFDAPWG